MSFYLEVEFAGLCLYVVHPTEPRVAVLMPDARRNLTGATPPHLDNTDAVPHVGYLRFDLADVDPRLPARNDRSNREGPEYEVIHRFDRQVLEFTGLGDEEMSGVLDVPDFSEFATDLQLIPDLFSASPPPALLMRAVLEGGVLEGGATKEAWTIVKNFDRRLKRLNAKYASGAIWTRRVDADSLGVTITDFEGVEEAAFSLRPAREGEPVRLKLANLCADNPMEWMEMDIREVNGPDVDFKWLYRLLEHTVGFTGVLSRGRELPVPEPAMAPLVGSLDDCMPGRITAAF